MTIAFGPEKDGLSRVRLTAIALQAAVVYGEAKADGNGYRISLTRLEWFNNWANGWTEASFLLDGTAVLRPVGPDGLPGGWTFSVENEPQLDSVESATIRYFQTYVRDDQGKTEFAHRWDRIKAVTDDLQARAADLASPGSMTVAAFADQRALRRYLFPEIYGYYSPPTRDHASALAQGYRWNLDYSKESFAEPLRILRDSGTLLRDYKESPGLWFLALGWKAFWETSPAMVLVKTR